MTFNSTIALAFAMLILAITPGPGVFLVSSQTITYNLRAGFLTATGIVIADIVFILIVTYGLATLTKNLQTMIVFINIFGGFYLIYLGVSNFKRKVIETKECIDGKKTHSKVSYFRFMLSGFMITLSNPKAILFYLSFLPAFVDLHNLNHIDVITIILTAIIIITPTMMSFAIVSNKAATLSQQNSGHPQTSIITKISAVLIIILGCYMIYRSTL